MLKTEKAERVLPKDAKEFVCNLAEEGCYLDESSILGNLIYRPPDNSQWEYLLKPSGPRLGRGVYPYRVFFIDKSGDEELKERTEIEVAVKFDSSREDLLYNECGALREIVDFLCKDQHSGLIAAYCSPERHYIEHGGLTFCQSKYCQAKEDVTRTKEEEKVGWLPLEKYQGLIIERISEKEKDVYYGSYADDRRHKGWFLQEEVTADDAKVKKTGDGWEFSKYPGLGCNVIVMELLENPEKHKRKWIGKLDQWIGLCRQILALYNIDNRLIYADAKIENCAYDIKDNKLKLIDYGSAVPSSYGEYVATYPPTTSSIEITEDGLAKLKEDGQGKPTEEAVCQLMSFSMGVLGREILVRRSYPGKAKMLTLVKKYYNDLIQCTTVREIKEVLDAIDAIASSTEAKTSSKSSTHEESKTAESKTAEI